MEEAKVMIKGLRQIGVETEQERSAKERKAKLSRRRAAAKLKAANAVQDQPESPNVTPSFGDVLGDFEA